MNCTNIFFPQDQLTKLKAKERSWRLMGHKLNNNYVVIQLTPTTKFIEKNDQNGLEILGTIYHQENQPSPKANFESELQLMVVKTFKYPIVDLRTSNNNGKSFIFVTYKPPNYRNLEYLSINPILLQSVTLDEKSDTETIIMNKFQKLGGKDESDPLFDDRVLDLINNSYVTKRRKWYREEWSRFRKFSQSLIFKPFAYLISVLQALSIWGIYFISCINDKYEFTYNSAVLRQLDLRLRQLNFFPIQLLCYFDRNILSKQQDILDLPIKNSNLNINNSNYINFFNFAWLIFNDILLGISVHSLILANYDIIAKFVNEVLILDIMFEKLFRLISWVSFDNPAGFKLNDELGKFFGDLFLWTLQFWRVFLVDILTLCPESKFNSSLLLFTTSPTISKLNPAILINSLTNWNNFFQWSTILFKFYLKIICYCGFTFLVSFIIDYFQIISFHIYCFYYSSAKIYKRQIQILKSLFQLVCGRKYNVLRNRIDKLDVYSNTDDSYDVEKLLLGTLFFVILSVLLPTTFAFYLLFFGTRLICLLLIYLGENILVFTNFFPIFVMLLKLKNSDRLQGGLIFKWEQVRDSTTYLQLKNKSLNYSDIFGNFFKLFRNSKTFTRSLIPNFINGEFINLEQGQKQNLKYNYLMLPRNYEITLSIWNYFTCQD